MTTPYYIRISPVAVKQLKALPAKDRKLIIKLVEALAINPRPPGVKKLDGMSGLYCEAIQSHRLIYKIEDQEILLLLVK